MGQSKNSRVGNQKAQFDDKFTPHNYHGFNNSAYISVSAESVEDATQQISRILKLAPSKFTVKAGL